MALGGEDSLVEHAFREVAVGKVASQQEGDVVNGASFRDWKNACETIELSNVVRVGAAEA